MSCMIVCASACRCCPAIACLDRIAEYDAPEGKEQNLQAKCAMRSDLSCRICHDDTCRVRMAKRTP